MKTLATFEYLLPGKTAEISRYFSDFNLFGKHHPYMTEAIQTEIISDSKSRYRVTESLKLWDLIPMKPIYEVDVEIIEPGKHIHYQAEVSKGVFLDIDYTFVEEANTVKVIEAMVLKGYPIINPIFIGLLKKSRALLMDSIRNELTQTTFYNSK